MPSVPNVRSYESHYEDVIYNHWPVCGYHPVQCQKGCGKSIERRAVKTHVTRDCPKTIIDCDFHHVRCDVRLPRKDMPAHLKADLITHMSLQAASYKQLQEKVNKLESENESLKQTSTPTLGYIEFTMEEFEEHNQNGTKWLSPPFYTHHRGYKLSLTVCANGSSSGKGKYISLYVYLMRGEFDDHAPQVAISWTNYYSAGRPGRRGQSTMKYKSPLIMIHPINILAD